MPVVTRGQQRSGAAAAAQQAAIVAAAQAAAQAPPAQEELECSDGTAALAAEALEDVLYPEAAFIEGLYLQCRRDHRTGMAQSGADSPACMAHTTGLLAAETRSSLLSGDSSASRVGEDLQMYGQVQQQPAAPQVN